MQFDDKEVDFNKYCTLCKDKLLSEIEDPCNECLTFPTNIDSHKPIMFEPK